MTPKAHHEPGKAHAVVPHRKEFIAFPGNFRIDQQEGTLTQVHGDDALENSNLRSRYRSAEPVFCAELLQGTLETLRRHAEPAMRPDYACGRVVAEDQLERALVAVGVEIEFPGSREIDHPLDHLARRVVAEDMKFADAPIGTPAELRFEQRQGSRVPEPVRAIRVAAIRADEGHDVEIRRSCGEQHARPLVGRAGHQDRPDAVSPKDVEHDGHRVRRHGLGVVVQMGIEDRHRRLGERGQRGPYRYGAAPERSSNTFHAAPVQGSPESRRRSLNRQAFRLKRLGARGAGAIPRRVRRFEFPRMQHPSNPMRPMGTNCTPLLRECGIFVPMEYGSMTGDRSHSILVAVALERSTTRKENYGYCQESVKEDRQEGRQEACGEEVRQETREESTGEESCAEESQEVGGQAQAERRIHETDDAVEHTRQRSRRDATAAYGSHQEDLGLHQEEQAAGLDQQTPDQCRRKAAANFWRQEAGIDVRDDQTGFEPSQVGRVAGAGAPLDRC